MADVCVYTANMGRYDTPREPAEQNIDVDWHYFTDAAGPGSTPPAARTRWTVHCTQPRQDTPMMAAKWWKMHPPVGYEYAIWIDANMEITSPSFAREALAALAGTGVDGNDALFAVWKHPRRDDLFDEIEASIGAERQGDKYDDEMLRKQGEYYRRHRMPRHSGLYACGTIVWRPEAWPLARDWWSECVDWTPQDQVSLPFVCWLSGVRPAVFPYPQIDPRLSRRAPYLANRWLRIHPHS